LKIKSINHLSISLNRTWKTIMWFTDILRLGNSHRYSRQICSSVILFRGELWIAIRLEFKLLLWGKLLRKTKS